MRKLPRMSRQQARALLQWAKKSRDVRLAFRAQIVAAAGRGRSALEICRTVGCARSQVYRVVDLFVVGGREALWDARRGNGQRVADIVFIATVRGLLESSPRDFGFDRATWTRELLVIVGGERTGVQVSVRTMSRVLRRLGARRGKPKPVVARRLSERQQQRRLQKIRQVLAGLGPDAGFDEVRIDGLGSLLARVGNGKKKLVIDAHIDTVGVGDPAQWKLPPHSGVIKDGLVHGRGASDQLGGAASMVTAGRILKELGYAGDWSVWFTFTTIEEDCDGLCWKYLIEEERFVPDLAVSTEPTSCRLYRGHRGRTEIEIHIKGVSCHGSAPERGESAAYKAARAALAIEKLNAELEPDDDGFLGKGTITVSQIKVHGPSQCAVPDQAMLYCDRRLTWGEDDKIAIAQVEKALTDAGVGRRGPLPTVAPFRCRLLLPPPERLDGGAGHLGDLRLRQPRADKLQSLLPLLGGEPSAL